MPRDDDRLDADLLRHIPLTARVILDVGCGAATLAAAYRRLNPRARIFGIEPASYRAIRARFVEGASRDPYEVLGVSAFAPIDQVRTAWKAAVRDTHPDRMMARGVPPEAVKLSERRLIAINAAWDEINAKRAA